jgi:hypothetical protein
LARGREVDVDGQQVTITLPEPEAVRDFAMRLPLEILNVIADPIFVTKHCELVLY